MSGALYSGGCQCGAVRFRASQPGTSEICHCRMCQKAFGSYFAPLVAVGAVEWTRGEPAGFRSSNMSRRIFCAQCGTPLGLLDDNGSVELASGSFDDPEALPPTVQFNQSSRLGFFDRLPDLASQPNPQAEHDANAKVIGYQHPDHDTETWPPNERIQ